MSNKKLHQIKDIWYIKRAKASTINSWFSKNLDDGISTLNGIVNFFHPTIQAPEEINTIGTLNHQEESPSINWLPNEQLLHSLQQVGRADYSTQLVIYHVEGQDKQPKKRSHLPKPL